MFHVVIREPGEHLLLAPVLFRLLRVAQIPQPRQILPACAYLQPLEGQPLPLPTA
jgi:hypothetical protein